MENARNMAGGHNSEIRPKMNSKKNPHTNKLKCTGENENPQTTLIYVRFKERNKFGVRVEFYSK